MSTYNPKLNEKIKELKKMAAGCFVRQKNVAPFKIKNGKDAILRCKKHQGEYEQFWFEKYAEYIKTFRNQT